ncbi:MAG: aconitase X swivel domain-containing protein [Actinomycetota bacterium]
MTAGRRDPPTVAGAAPTPVAGEAQGPVLCLTEPISFWGGVNPASGRIVETRHPQAGSSVTGTVLVMPYSRGSTSSPSVVAEMIRVGTAPAGVILGRADHFIVLGALVAEELYRLTMPVVILEDPRMARASRAWIQADGRVRFQ